MKNKKTILFFVYFLLGIIILSADRLSAGIYFTVVPLQYALLRAASKSRNLYLILFFFFLLFSIGGSSVTFFLTRYNRSTAGTANIGSFDFSLSYFFIVYSYLFVFYLATLLFTKGFNKQRTVNGVSCFIKQEIDRFTTNRASMSIGPLFVVATVFAYISVWMYNQHIGITGILSGRTLPFHLSGILYYARRLLFTFVILYLFFRTKNKKLAFPIIVLYALIVGVSASSKSINMLVLVPIAFYFFFTGEKKLGYLALFLTTLIYAYVAGARELIFASDGAASLIDVFKTANEVTLMLLDDTELVVVMINSFFGSLFGIDNPIVAYQYTRIGFQEFVSYFSGSYIGDVIPDMVFRLYDFDLPDDRAYGICLGISGAMVIMANRNFIIILLEALIIAILFAVQNSALYEIMRIDGHRVCKYICLGLIVFFFYSLIAADSMRGLYLATIVMYSLKYYLSHRRLKKISM